MFRGPVDCARQLLMAEGFRGLTRGLSLTATREIIGNGIYFGAYEWLRCGADCRPRVALAFPKDASCCFPPCFPSGRRGLMGERTPPKEGRTYASAAIDMGSAVLSGGLAGVAVWLVLLPVDTVKTVHQITQPGPRDLGIRVSAMCECLLRPLGSYDLLRYAGPLEEHYPDQGLERPVRRVWPRDRSGIPRQCSPVACLGGCNEIFIEQA